MSDSYVSFFLTQESLSPKDGWLPPASHLIPFDMEVDRVRCFIGCAIGNPPQYALDIAADVIRESDGFALARFRDDHYNLPVGDRQSRSEEQYYSPWPFLREGEIVTTQTYCYGNPDSPDWVQAYIAIELVGFRCCFRKW